MIDNGKAAIITGGGQGIGKAVVQRLLREGLSVAFADLEKEAGEETEKGLEPLGQVKFIHADVADEQMVRDAVGQTMERFGLVDLVENNAGIMVRKPVTGLSLAEWERVISVNLTGTFLLVKHAGWRCPTTSPTSS